MVLPSTRLGGEHFQQHPLKAAVGRWDQMSTETAKAENRLPSLATLWRGFLFASIGTPLRIELRLG
jgi:hypothetical protein